MRVSLLLFVLRLSWHSELHGVRMDSHLQSRQVHLDTLHNEQSCTMAPALLLLVLLMVMSTLLNKINLPNLLRKTAICQELIDCKACYHSDYVSKYPVTFSLYILTIGMFYHPCKKKRKFHYMKIQMKDQIMTIWKKNTTHNNLTS